MSTTNYPACRPLLDPSGKVVFLPTHINYVIDGVAASNPVLKGPLKMGSTVVFNYVNGVPQPLGVGLGGTGTTSLASLASSLLTSLGFNSSGVLPVSKGGTGSTTAAAALAALGGASAKRYQVNIPTSGWTANSSGGYYKAVRISGLLATDVPVAGVVLSNDVATAKNQLKAAGCVNRMVTSANTITLYAYSSAPTTAFDLQLMCIRNYT